MKTFAPSAFFSTASTATVALVLGSTPLLYGQTVADFSDVALSIPPAEAYAPGGVYYRGADGAGGFFSGGLHFETSYDAQFGSWSGWAYSTTTDTTTAGWGNQFSSFAGGGQGDATYAIGFNASLALNGSSHAPQSVFLTNTTYAGLSMTEGDDFAKKFGGDDGTDPDFFLLTITGKDALDAITGTVEFYLADFRFDDSSQDYIVDEWTQVDLTDLGTGVSELEFSLSSSDVGEFGMNTPAYFALDTFVAVPEPSSTVALLGAVAMLGGLVRRRR